MLSESNARKQAGLRVLASMGREIDRIKARRIREVYEDYIKRGGIRGQKHKSI